MKIIDILKDRRTISCEFFPPRTEEGISGVFGAIQRLQRFKPDFISVTYGAGGSTRAFTERITVEAKELGDMEVMAHLTCVGQTKEEVHGVLERLDASGIDNVIALRGDPPRGESNFVPVEGGFEHATELIDHIQRNFEFGLAAACYPEGHTESVDLQSDLEYTKLKVNKGADFLITQLFYDNADFFGFMDRAAKAGINVPIIPGMLPILNTAQIRRFTALCGAKIPAGLDQKLDRYADDDDAVRELGVEHATRQAEELWASGVPGIHFYVLNRSYSVSKILGNLGLPKHNGLVKTSLPDVCPHVPPRQLHSTLSRRLHRDNMLSTGVDIIEIERVRHVLDRYGERFLRRVFTEGEIAYCRGRPANLAARFAAKEATMKALGTGVRGVGWRDIEVVRSESGAPSVKLHNRAKQRAIRLAVREISLSLSHSRDYAVAFVVAEREEPAPSLP